MPRRFHGGGCWGAYTTSVGRGKPPSLHKARRTASVARHATAAVPCSVSPEASVLSGPTSDEAFRGKDRRTRSVLVSHNQPPRLAFKSP